MSQTRIALCSDTHFWPGAKERFGPVGSQLQPWSEQIQAALLAELKAAAPDLLIHSGDLTCGGGSFDMPHETFFAALDASYAAFKTLPADFHILPGNHDCPAGGDWSYAEARFGLAAGLGQTIDLPEARLILVNAQGHLPEQLAAAWPDDPIYGWVNEAEQARLAEALAGAGDRPILIFIHQLLRPWAGDQPWRDLYGVENVDAVLAILAQSGNVRGVFQSHAHRLDVHQTVSGVKPCWFIIGPALIEYPLAWLLLDLSPGQLHVTMQRLPLAELAALSQQTGDGQAWRAGRPEWRDFTIML